MPHTVAVWFAGKGLGAGSGLPACACPSSTHPCLPAKRAEAFDCPPRNHAPPYARRGRWASEADCCAPGAAHSDGCTKSEPCWVATAWYPARACGQVKDDAVCLRGWGAFATEDDCCAPGAAHSDGCGLVAEAGAPKA